MAQNSNNPAKMLGLVFLGVGGIITILSVFDYLQDWQVEMMLPLAGVIGIFFGVVLLVLSGRKPRTHSK